ncbi:hypothetical protein VTN02DRAFT_5852 [Thermoascus thermophilus]
MLQPQKSPTPVIKYSPEQEGFAIPTTMQASGSNISPAEQELSSTISGDSKHDLRAPTDSINLISHDMRTLVGKIQDLRHLGIEDSKIALPKICVVGDQSTGKSSLIEGMSEIKVPRSSGTCTRCPMEINLSESDPTQPWTCRILLSRKYMYDGSRRITKLPKKSQPLGPWIEHDEEQELFAVLTDKAQVPEALKSAQLAILNPGRPSTDYTPGQDLQADANHYQVKFSPNVIRLDISAPNFPNLSFYDLPGVISQAELDEERYLVTLVENLVKAYISQENCIILLTLPMTDDATNSSAARIIRDVPGAKSRTLGVLTKPDRVQVGESYDQWTDILGGNKFSLGHGYFVVMNNPDPGIEHSQARAEETRFFASHPWCTEFAEFQERFGTRRLQTALSGLLLDQIQGCLPRIIQQIDQKAERIDAELHTLPDPPSANIPYILCGKLNLLRDQVRAHLDGGSAKYPLQKIWGRIAVDFKLSLAYTRPNVKLLADSDSITLQLGQSNGGDSDCEMTFIRSSLKRKTPSDKGSPDVKGKQQAPRRTQYATAHFEAFNEPAKVFTWEEIRDINEDSYRAGLPDQTDPKAIEIMNQISVQHWDQPMSVFLAVSHTLVRDMLMEQLRSIFSQYRQTGFYRELKRIIENYVETLKREHHRYAFEIYSIERSKPFTMATVPLELARKEALQFLSKHRHNARAKCYLDLQGKFPQGDPRRKTELEKITEAQLGPDKFVQELRMMAIVKGYYEVASSRFVDSICQSVHTKLFTKCRDELVQIIEQELGVFKDDALERCMELMAEDPERQRRRQYLVKERQKLTKAQEWLQSSAKKEDSDMDDINALVVAA